MDEESLRELLARFAAGGLSQDDVVAELRFLPYRELGFAKVDHHREMRTGLPEAVFGPGKTPAQAAAICVELAQRARGPVLVTRATPAQFEAVAEALPEAEYLPDARLIVARRSESAPDGLVAVAAAGTSDLPVAEEAAATAEAAGLKVERITDVGVAGLHRLLDHRDALDRADIVIAVAGMEGALPGILAGLIGAPVIAVPTSVGYGAGAGGIAPLLTMLNSCAPGVAVVNIDNGYGAAVFASLMLKRLKR